MRRFVGLPFALLFLMACASSRHTPTQTIGVQISAPPPPVEYFLPPDVRSLRDAIAADFEKTIGPVDMNPQPGAVPIVSISVVWERLGSARSTEQDQEMWFTLNYKLTTASGVREGSIPAWRAMSSNTRLYPDDQKFVIQRAVAALRTAIQKAL